MTAALLLGSNAPDIDIVTTAGGSAAYLQWHRGPTHGPVGIVALGLVTAALVVGGRRLWGGRAGFAPARAAAPRDAFPSAPASFGALAVASTFAVLCHVLMDLPTSYGTRILSPFSWTWFAEDWFPIVDLYLLTILGATLWFGRRAPTRNATIALSLMLAYYGFRGVLHARAIAIAPSAFGAQLPQPCEGAAGQAARIDSWPRPPLGASPEPRRDVATTRCLMEIAALPDFVSPFRWRLIAQLTNSYEVRTVDLVGRARLRSSDARVLSVRYPNQWTPAAERASNAPTARTFLAFSRFPSVRSMIDEDGNATVVWTDLRFLAFDGPLESPRPPPSFFAASVRVSPDGTILSARLH